MKYYYICIRIGEVFTNIIPHYGNSAQQLELTCIAGGMQNGVGTLENSMPVSYKVKHTPTIQTSNPTLGI